MLVQQERFDRAAACLQHFVKSFEGQRGIIRFWSQAGKQDLGVPHEPDPAEFARVVKAEPPARIKVQSQTVVFVEGALRGFHPQIAAHAQVDYQD